MSRIASFASLMVAGIPFLVVTAHAQDMPAQPIESITVTASLREATQLATAASVTVLDQTLLQEAGQQHLESVLQLVPNLNWAGGTSRPRYFQIRGIGERSQYEGAPNPSVGFLVDDIDFSGMGGVATLFDTRQVEVLRGPQGTALGANALAGLISVRTVDPGDTFELNAEATAGSDSAQGIGLALGGPLSERMGYRLVAQRSTQDGFRDNRYLDASDTNRRDELTTRGKLHWAISNTLRAKFTAMLVDLDNGYDAWAIDNSLNTLSDKPGEDSQRTAAMAARIEWDASKDVTLLSITTVADSDVLFSFDGDWGNDDSWGEYAPYDFFSSTRRERRSLGQEFRLGSRPGAEIFGASTAWIIGLYGLDTRETNDILDTYNGDIYRSLDSDYQATNLALFGQLDARLAVNWSLAFGLRLERREASYIDSQGVSFSPVDNMPGGHLTLAYEFTPRARFYSTLARGYKAGGFNIDPSIPEDRRIFDPEYLWNLEIGFKGVSPRHGLAGSVAVFYMDREDAQVSTSFQDDPSDPLSFTFYNDNAAEGVNYGLEGQLRWDLAMGWALNAGLGLLHSEFRDYEAGTRVLDGREQAHAPSWNYSLGISYHAATGFFARADVVGRDSFYFSDSHDQRSEAYSLVNGRLGYEGVRWSAYLWARNVFDRVYQVRGFYFANEPPDWEDKLYTRQGDPRQLGLTLSYRY
ncbi:MAG: TonB-dependent receptor [Gammaproteobacteria bacterium]|nr:TonB-dependent receptor [Gammaproteobacteria bacterium]